MEIAFGIIFYIIFGIILAKLARLVGSKIFKNTDIYEFFLRLLKETRDK